MHFGFARCVRSLAIGLKLEGLVFRLGISSQQNDYYLFSNTSGNDHVPQEKTLFDSPNLAQ